MGSQRTKSNLTAINPDKPIQQKTGTKALAISFLLTISLSLIISQSLPLDPSTIEIPLLEQQLVYAKENNNAANDDNSELEDAIVSTKDEEKKESTEDSKGKEDGEDNDDNQSNTRDQQKSPSEGFEETDAIIEPAVLILNSNSSEEQLTSEVINREPPDDDCLFDPSLPKCAPIDGQCPDGFAMNEDGQCYPRKPCPSGFERVDDDETGACRPITENNLKVILNVKGTDGSGKVSVKSETTGKTISRTVDNVKGSHTFNFKKGQIPIGGEFKACAESDKLDRERCTSGKNGPENEPERVIVSFSDLGSGLKVIVTIKGTDGSGKVSVTSGETGKSLSREVDNIKGTHTFNFKAGEVPVGKAFEACAHSDKLGKELCTRGRNGPENAPERVVINFQESPSTRVLELTTNKKTYDIGETVTFTIKNNGGQTLEFPNGNYGLQIKNLDTGKNCDRISTDIVTELKPGESIKQKWDQKCRDGKSVKAGKYNAKVASGSLSSDTTFNIRQVLKWN